MLILLTHSIFIPSYLVVVGPTQIFVIVAVVHLKMEHVGEANVSVLFLFYVKLVTKCISL